MTRPGNFNAHDNSDSPAIGILEGVDIGHEITPASVAIARAAAELHGVAIDWRPLPIGARTLATHGHTLPADTMTALETRDGRDVFEWL